MDNTGTKPKNMSNTIKVILTIVVEVAIIAVWLVILAPWYNSTQIIAEIPDNSTKEVSVNNPTIDEIKQYRMIYHYENSRELIIDLQEENRAVFAVIYYGDANFEMTLKTHDGKDFRVIKDQQGPFEFVHNVDVPYTGPYLIEVNTEGDWSIEQR
jgi:hypothetical protein